MYGTKEGTTSTENGKIKVDYYTHVELNNISDGIRKVLECDLTVENITLDKSNGLWKIKYFEIL